MGLSITMEGAMSAFEIRHVPRQDAAVILQSCPPDGISAAMGPALGRVFESVGRAGGVPAGPVFARYLSFSDERIDFECGIVVQAPFAGDGEVHASDLGGCEAAVGVHVGPYETLQETYAAMEAWIAEQGRQPGPVMWEIYLTDPESEPDPARWRTEVVWPVA
jgi:effector-binding domain-containing protein